LPACACFVVAMAHAGSSPTFAALLQVATGPCSPGKLELARSSCLVTAGSREPSTCDWDRMPDDDLTSNWCCGAIPTNAAESLTLDTFDSRPARIMKKDAAVTGALHPPAANRNLVNYNRRSASAETLVRQHPATTSSADIWDADPLLPSPRSLEPALASLLPWAASALPSRAPTGDPAADAAERLLAKTVDPFGVMD